MPPCSHRTNGAVPLAAFFVRALRGPAELGHVVRMDAPGVRTRIGYATLEEASPDRLYRRLTKLGLGRSFGDIGHLRWRILMLAVCFVILFVPLRRSLNQLRDRLHSSPTPPPPPQALGGAAGEILARALQQRLQVPKLRLLLVHTQPATSAHGKPLVRESAFVAPA